MISQCISFLAQYYLVDITLQKFKGTFESTATQNQGEFVYYLTSRQQLYLVTISPIFSFCQFLLHHNSCIKQSKNVVIPMLLKLSQRLCSLTLTPMSRFGMLSDYFAQKTMKKQQGEFKKEMEYLANKPKFTLLDYKQRIEDQLARANSNIKSKFNNENLEQTRNLEMEKKVLCSLFEEELNMQQKVRLDQKKEISLVTQLPLEFVTKAIGKFEEYRKMHRVLRSLRLRNKPLPQSVDELRQEFLSSPAVRPTKKQRYLQYRRVTTAKRNAHTKREFDHGYFDV